MPDLPVNSPLFRQPGDAVLLRGVWQQKICFAISARVVLDTSELAAFYWCAGTPNKVFPRRFSARDFLTLDRIDLVDSCWTSTDVLALAPAGAAHSVYAMWEHDSGAFRCWYVNLEQPLRRTSLGFDTMDYLLDIVINPDLRTWFWKDEDEFKEAVSEGMFTREQTQDIRQEGERLLNTLHDPHSIFKAGWECWRPPSGWTIPAIPPGWCEIES